MRLDAIKYGGRWYIASLVHASKYGKQAVEFASGKMVWSEQETTAWICRNGDEECRVRLEPK